MIENDPSKLLAMLSFVAVVDADISFTPLSNKRSIICVKHVRSWFTMICNVTRYKVMIPACDG